MREMKSCLYVGEVVHRRLMPVTHELRYRVFNFFVDVDELPQLAEPPKAFQLQQIQSFQH